MKLYQTCHAEQTFPVVFSLKNLVVHALFNQCHNQLKNKKAYYDNLSKT